MKGHPDAAFIFPAHPQFVRNADVYHPFRQESDFHYLSGFDEPESFLVLAPKHSFSGGYHTIAFILPSDPTKELWEGKRYGVERAESVFGFDEVYLIQDLEKLLPEILSGAEKLFYRLGFCSKTDGLILRSLQECRKRKGRSGCSILPVFDPTAILGEMRLFKGSEEIALLRKACSISAKAHLTAMKEVRPGMNEAEVEALLDYIMRKQGCQRLAYGSIVASGENATCLHYHSNDAVLKEGDLLLIDAGGEFDFYAADITRTFPVSQSFSQEQGWLYDLVLQAQLEAIAMTRPGTRLSEIHLKVCTILTEGLLSLGLLKGKLKENLTEASYRRFYPHSTSHWLGLDVHDSGPYAQTGEPRILESGMVFTIEPGLYFQIQDLTIPERYRGIGIRIEDDIHVTEKGCEILTNAILKERALIEQVRRV